MIDDDKCNWSASQAQLTNLKPAATFNSSLEWTILNDLNLAF